MLESATYLVGVRTEAKVLHGLTSILGTTEEQSVGTSGGSQSKLVKSQNLAAGLLDTSASCGSEAQSGDRQLRHSQEAVVVRHGTNHNDSLALLRIVDVRGDTGKRNRGTVDARHEETAEDGLVEVGLGAAYRDTSVRFSFHNAISDLLLCRHKFKRKWRIVRARKR